VALEIVARLLDLIPLAQVPKMLGEEFHIKRVRMVKVHGTTLLHPHVIQWPIIRIERNLCGLERVEKSENSPR
jgi:hypothetical protein